MYLGLTKYVPEIDKTLNNFRFKKYNFFIVLLSYLFQETYGAYLFGVSIVGLHAKSRLSILSHVFKCSLAGSWQAVGLA